MSYVAWIYVIQGVLVRRVEPTSDANKVLKEVFYCYHSFNGDKTCLCY